MNTYSLRVLWRGDRKRKRDGLAQVYLRVSINSQQFWQSTGIYLAEKDWNPDTREVRKSHPDYNALNIEIRENQAIANSIFDEYRRARKVLTKEIFRQCFDHPSSREDFIAYMRLAISVRLEVGEIVEGTAKQHRVVYNKLVAWRSSLLFSEITQRQLDEFDMWHLGQLRKKKGAKLVNHGEGPRSNAWKIIKTYLRRAAKDEIAFEMPGEFRTQQHAPEAPHLSSNLVKRLQKIYENPKQYPEHWREILRMFLWMCFTGQSFIDAQEVNWEENIIDGTLKYTRHKTRRYRKLVTVPLSPAAKHYLPRTKEGKLFKSFSDQHYNRELKKIATAADIPIKLSAKVARDTFGTLFCEAVGGDVFTLMDLMGHQKIETTRKYVHLSEGHKARQLLRAFEDFKP